MAGDVRQVQVDGSDESWERVTDEVDVRWVGADRIDFAGGWNVTVAVMEFVREDPLESELRRRIAAALRQKSWTTSSARHARMPEPEGEHIR